MFERLSPTKVLLENPKNRKMKRFIDTSIAANGPMLENLMKRRAEDQDITLVIDTMFKQSLKFGTRIPKNLLFFAREVATAWDSFSKEEREEAGLDSDFCKQNSLSSTYFSNIRRGSASFGIILDSAGSKRSMIKRWKLLFDLQHETVPFEKVQTFFLEEAKECLQLTSFEVTKNGVVLIGERVHLGTETGQIETIPGEIKLVHTCVYSNIAEYEEKLSILKNSIANRLIVGYSPAL